MMSSISFLTLLVGLSVLALSAQAFRMNSGFGLTKRTWTSNALHMSTPGGTVSQVTGAMPNANEYLEILEPGLKKATLGMFQAVKEIAYKIRTVQCDKYTCYVQERGEMVSMLVLHSFCLLYLRTHIHTHTNVYIYIYIYIHTHIHLYVFMYIYLYVYT